jgi:hypothetical protein
MQAAEVVVHEVQCHSMRVILDLLGKAIGQAMNCYVSLWRSCTGALWLYPHLEPEKRPKIATTMRGIMAVAISSGIGAWPAVTQLSPIRDRLPLKDDLWLRAHKDEVVDGNARAID